MPVISGVPDAMSDVLSLVRMRGEFVCVNEYSAPWSIRFDRPIAHFHIVERGSAWLTVHGETPQRIETGDLAILPHGAGHALASSPKLKPVPIMDEVRSNSVRQGSVFKIGGDGEATHVLCGQFAFDGVLAPKLLTILPPVMLIRAEQGRPLEWLRLTAHFLTEETRFPKPGSAIMIARLLDLLFIQAVREWGQSHSHNLGWLSGLRDSSIGRALSAMHERPARAWTVAQLSEVAGLSRSAFAARFQQVVGQPPLRYLAVWRLDLAADLLRAGDTPIADIAAQVGYGSESALTRAFKAHFESTPAAFRRAGKNLATPGAPVGAGATLTDLQAPPKSRRQPEQSARAAKRATRP